MNQSTRTQEQVSEYSFSYYEALCQAMNMIADEPDTVFVGQGVDFPGTFMSTTLSGVPNSQRIELPVAEEMQMGLSIGMALAGNTVVSLFPRWNFLILAANQLVNHLDKIPLMSEYRPKVIVRVGVGSERPLHPGPQHVGDFTEAFRLLLQTVVIERIDEPDEVIPAYQRALNRDGSTVLVEIADFYNEK